MLSNSPMVRRIVYGAAVVAQVAAFFLRAGDHSGVWSSAAQDTANFLGSMAGLTALGNISSGQPPAPNA